MLRSLACCSHGYSPFSIAAISLASALRNEVRILISRLTLKEGPGEFYGVFALELLLEGAAVTGARTAVVPAVNGFFLIAIRRECHSVH